MKKVKFEIYFQSRQTTQFKDLKIRVYRTNWTSLYLEYHFNWGKTQLHQLHTLCIELNFNIGALKFSGKLSYNSKTKWHGKSIYLNYTLGLDIPALDSLHQQKKRERVLLRLYNKLTSSNDGRRRQIRRDFHGADAKTHPRRHPNVRWISWPHQALSPLLQQCSSPTDIWCGHQMRSASGPSN